MTRTNRLILFLFLLVVFSHWFKNKKINDANVAYAEAISKERLRDLDCDIVELKANNDDYRVPVLYLDCPGRESLYKLFITEKMASQVKYAKDGKIKLNYHEKSECISTYHINEAYDTYMIYEKKNCRKMPNKISQTNDYF